MTSSTDSARRLLRAAFDAAVAAADPVEVLNGAWPEPPPGRTIVLALGKAAAAMAAAAERHYAKLDRSVEGVAVVPYGYGVATRHVDVHEAGHPVPDAASVEGATRLLRLAEAAGPDDLALVLVSGGGSALATMPDGVTLEQLSDLNRTLLASGADVREMNMVRRRLDRIKGGGLAAAAYPAKTEARVVSDVVGDTLLDVASGPTVGDPADADAALRILDRYHVAAPAVREALEAERSGTRTGPVRPGDARLERTATRIVASNARSLEAAERVIAAAGYATCILSDSVSGDAREAAGEQAAQVLSLLRDGRLLDGRPLRPPAALLSGGETTVTVRGGGRGGRNSTFALALALALPDGAPVHALIADSDGIDGVGGHAGAFVGPDTVRGITRAHAQAYDRDDDSYAAFERAGGLLRTGPTRTNVNDLRLLLVGLPDGASGGDGP